MDMKLITRLRLAMTVLITVSVVTIAAMEIRISVLCKEVGVSAISTYVSATLGIIILIAVAVTLTGFYIRRLKEHADKLSDYSQKIASGITNFEVKRELNDEFAQVYDAFQGILEYNRNNAKLTEAIADGDLTGTAIVKCPEDLMGVSLADLIKNNNEVLSGIRESSYQLTTGAEQVASASQALAQGSTEQASAIEQITVSMKDIENMTQDNANQANQANEIVKNTKNAAELGNKRMDEMKDAMGEINTSSEKISKIIKVIDDISFQTNILALNAAVEAARAGTHGKGFAVVAEQIRELAGKSAQAAAETADMIDDSIRKVHNGTKLADETAKALNQIMDNISNVVEITESITKASNEQATAVAQIDQAIIQVSQVVQNNSATSEECAAASEELSGQSMALRQMISKYKLSKSLNEDDSQEGYSYGKSGYGSYHSSSNFSYDDKDVNPADIISLDGDFGKY